MLQRIASTALAPGLLALLSLLLAACSDDAARSSPPPDEKPLPRAAFSGGEGTVFDTSREAFSLAARNLKDARRDRFFVGNALFNRNWVTAPSSTTGLDGLGPTFNASSCSACHFKDGRGQPPESEGEPFVGLLLRLSVPGENEHGGPVPEPNYGDQFNHESILGVASEGHAAVTYTEVPGAYDDGTPYSLAKPLYTFAALAFGPLDGGVLVSPRVAPGMQGLGLLEALDGATIEAAADPDDADGDGISGRANHVWDVESGSRRLGRFGWKSNQPSLEQQSAGAFLGDVGISSRLFPAQNCPPVQIECAGKATGGSPELDDDKLDDITYYSHFLAVPARRDVGESSAGEALFQETGCATCHTPDFRTGTLAGFPELSEQDIHPYTDLLLHDLGDALADGRPDFEATGSEWRTPPLWGVGLVSRVNGHTRLLHDGRARNVEEAVLWHGGEAERARDAFRALPEADRAALLFFLESL
jgi:CxxC motif-containing protein (DUF1111 family)